MSAIPGATIYYTINGQLPAPTQSYTFTYSGPLNNMGITEGTNSYLVFGGTNYSSMLILAEAVYANSPSLTASLVVPATCGI